MTTERLYFADAYLTSFSARIVARAERDGKPAVALDQSAFYPEGGGQPPDTGALGGVRVVDVQMEDGVVWHTLEAPLEGEHVRGTIDWPRRLDHMQQHHGQHLLSAAFERLFELPTLSFHLGAAISTIDLAAAALSDVQVAAAEDLVNHVIWEDRSVLARFVTPEELATLPLRKPPKVSGAVRVVSVPEFDHSACGGTHPRSTGGVGVLHVRRWERRGETVRVEFLCGARALRDYRARDAALMRLAADLSVGVDELGEALARLRTAEERARKGLAQAGEQLIAYEAAELLGRDQSAGELPVVRRAFEGRPIEELRLLARAIAERGGLALLGTRADKAQLVFARGEGLAVDCGALLRQALATVGGRGGGQPALAQGGLPDPARLEEVLDAASQAATAG
ncbi:MAG TPA: DHHA1 domain-containing protein [Roseiflexaceae bacterium]|nr:DHHA1 domain-containing protein [Roseiflexaceae bacterium]